MNPGVPVFFVLALLLSGCVAHGSPTAQRPAPKADAMADGGPSSSMEWPYVYTDCDLMTTAIRIDIEAARAVVADGFEPQDGGHMFNANPQLVDTGTTVLVIAAMSCAHIDVAGGPGSFAFAWIDIEEPSVAGEPSPSAHDGYGLIDVVEHPAHVAFLQQARLPVVAGGVSIAVETVSPGGVGGALGMVRIGGPDGTLAEIVSLGAGSIAAGVELANWHQTEEGVALTHLDSDGSVRFFLGKAVTCRVAEGSVLASLIGGTDCTAANGQGVIATGLSNAGSLRFWPGVRAETG